MSAARTREPGEIFGPRTTLFADVLSIGVVTALACLPLVTVPAALSTACAVLRGTRDNQPVTAGRYLALLRRRQLGRDLVAGAVALAGVLLLAADLALAGAGLPGARAFSVVAALAGASALVVALRACARPESATGWREAVRRAAGDAVRDPGGSALVLSALAAAVLCAWMMLPLAFLAPGPLALALTAIDVRDAGAARRRAGRARTVRDHTSVTPEQEAA
ncbi:hypothetical protein [Streptomyces sp. NBC_01429]|uniref:hypothetical protein n=1 Tax=Streptomyces sp. NBC_01429 TaxID=2903862 RepID=UPI002E2ACEEC|nr:hypothetical protein [Streptomyces sp. NBC_01429]